MRQVKLLKKWEQHLDSTHAIQGAVDAVGHHCLHILREIQYINFKACCHIPDKTHQSHLQTIQNKALAASLAAAHLWLKFCKSPHPNIAFIE